MKVIKILLMIATITACGGGGGGGGGGAAPAPTSDETNTDTNDNANVNNLAVGVIKVDIKSTNIKDPTVSGQPQSSNSDITVSPGSLDIYTSFDSYSNKILKRHLIR